MLDYVYGQDEIVAPFVAQLIPHCRRGFGPNVKTIGVISDGDLIYGCVYHNYDPEAEIIEMSGAAIPHRQWLTRATLARLYAYPFLELRCQMVVMRVPADNEYLLGILARYGYVFHRINRLFGHDRDGVVCTLTYEDWIDNKFNKPRVEQMKEAA